MIYADTDFFLALMKPTDWLQRSARKLLAQYKGTIWTSPTTLTELLLLATEFGLDPVRLIIDVLEISTLQGGEPGVFLTAASYIKNNKVRVFDALHAGYCGQESKIISSDRAFDKLGLVRVPLEAS